MEAALVQLIGNAFSAMDRLYFNTKPHIRSADWYAQKMCLRLTVTPNALSITDLGAGMTRADLINSLGVGRLSKKALRVVATKLVKKVQEPGNGETVDQVRDKPDVQVDKTDNTQTEEDQTFDTDDGDDDEFEDVDDGDDSKKDSDICILPCLEADIGGFYSALCALGHGVTIGTKVRSLCYDGTVVHSSQPTITHLLLITSSLPPPPPLDPPTVHIRRLL